MTTSICVHTDDFIISIRYKQNHPNTVLGIMIMDWFISISLCTLIPPYVVRMKKKVVRGGKKTERGSVEKGTENEKRSRVREKRKRAMQTYIHTRGQCQSYSVVCLLARRHYHDIADVVVFSLIIIVCVYVHIVTRNSPHLCFLYE
jgi:hypothetical protein